MKTVIVTGASGDIGKACCRKFLDKGYNVAACYCTNEMSVNELRDYAGDSALLIIRADISKIEDVKRIYDETAKKFGEIDAVINNAAISVHGLIQDVTEKELDDVVNINIRGTFCMCSIGIEYMLRNHRGSIVNISSMWGETGASCETVYSMSKAAVIGLTKALAKEAGPSGIRVNCVSPGLINTRMNDWCDEESLREIAEETPLMRMGTVDEVADAVLYLAGDSASFVTGQVLGVNGGYLI